MRDLTKEHQAVSGRGSSAFVLAASSILGITTLLTIPAHVAAQAVTPQQQAAAQRTAAQGIPVADLAPDAPSQYTVRRGDTLWDISGRYLRQPWRWPELWGMNRGQVHNPHLIYPGQVLYLVQRDGRAYLSATPAQGAGGDTVHLSPRVRGDAAEDGAIPSIPAKDIEPFLARPLVLEEDALASSARLVALPESHVFMGRGDQGYARGIGPDVAPGSDWLVYRPAQPVKDPVDGHVLGYQAEYEGSVRLERGPQGPDAVSVVRATQSQQEMGPGSLLLPQPPRDMVRYMPHAPDVAVEGRVAAVYGGLQYGGARQVVVLNVGSNAGLEPGHVLALSRAGGVTRDITDGNRTIALPDERYGLAFVFRVYKGISYALVTDASNVIAVGDRITSPH